MSRVERMEGFIQRLIDLECLTAGQADEARAALEESDQCVNCKKDSYWCVSTGMDKVYPCPDRIENAT